MLEVTKEIPGKYNIVHICGEMEFGFQSSPRRYAGILGICSTGTFTARACP